MSRTYSRFETKEAQTSTGCGSLLEFWRNTLRNKHVRSNHVIFKARQKTCLMPVSDSRNQRGEDIASDLLSFGEAGGEDFM